MNAEAELLLWGYTSVGKTALLATALYSNNRSLLPIDWSNADATPNSHLRALQEHWNRLSRNQMTDGTFERYAFTLALQNQNVLKIHDVRGGGAVDPFLDEFFQGADEHKGVLFVIGWDGRDIGSQILAINNGLVRCDKFKIGLAITKCESALQRDDPAWTGVPGWWRQHACWLKYEETLNRFGGQIWATSAFGYDADGRPACILGEYGQVMPFNIRPQNVAVPFASFLKVLGL